MHAIYCILNKVNSKRYIGSSVNFYTRKKLHLSQLKRDVHHSRYLQRSWNKYGEDNFTFIVLEKVDNKDNLLVREQWWLDNSNCEYNWCKIAGSSLGVKRTPEFCDKIRQRQLGLKHPEWRNKIKSEAQGGENHWTKKREAPFSKESKKKMSETHKKLYENGYEHPRKKQILQYSKYGDFVKEWNSLKEAGNELNINPDSISNNLRKISKSAGGFIWKYKNNNDE